MNMKNSENDTKCVDHNGKTVSMINVKDTVRLYQLKEQCHKNTEIRHMTLKQFKAKTFNFLNP